MSEHSALSVLQSKMANLQENGHSAEGLLELMGELQKQEYYWPFCADGTEVAPGAVLNLDSPQMASVSRKHVLYFPDDKGGRLAPLFTDVGTFEAVQPTAAAKCAYVKLRPFEAWSQIRNTEDCSAAIVASGDLEFPLSKDMAKNLRMHYVDTVDDAAAKAEFAIDPDY